MTSQYSPPTDGIRLGRAAFCETPRRRVMRRPAAWATFALCWALLVGVASGQTPDTNWTGEIARSWNDAWNWDNGVPTSATSAHIDLGRAYMDAGEGSHSAYDVFLGTWSGDNGALWLWPVNSLAITDRLVVGWYGTGDMRISKFCDVTVPLCIIGNFHASSGTLLLEGSAAWERAKLSVSTLLIVGGKGTGSLRLDDGHLISGTAIIGDYNQGTMTVSDTYAAPNHGSLWENSGDVTVGRNASATGVLNVNSGQVIIGGILKVKPNGTLNLTGGSIKTKSFIVDSPGIFNFHNGTLRVEGGSYAPGTLDWVVNGNTADALPRLVLYNAIQEWSNDVTIGSTAKGEMVVSGGTPVCSMDNGYLGYTSGSTGTASVSGAGSTWDIWDDLYIGGSSGTAGGTGLLTVSDGGHVNVGGILKTWNNGTLTLDGGSITTQSFNRSVGTFHFNDGTLTVDGGSSNWGTPNLIINGNTAAALPTLVLNNAAPSGTYGEIRVGDSRKGALTVSGGTDLSTTGNAYVAYAAGSTGTATVTGTGSTWSSSGSLYVGGSDTAAGGAGTLDVLNGAQVTVGGTLKIWSPGTVTLDGNSITTQSFDNSAGGTFNFYDGTLTVSGGTWSDTAADLIISGNTAAALPHLVLDNVTSSATYGSVYVGSGNPGQLTVSGGTDLTNTGQVQIGRSAAGTVTADGAGTTWNTGHQFVGVWNDGTLNITNGAQVSGGGAGTIGYDAAATGAVTVEGAGSAWSLASWLKVGGVGTGTMTVQQGGQVTSAGGRMGYSANTQGSVSVDGGGSAWNCTYLDVGERGTGYLSIGNGGTVSSTNTWVGRYAGAAGDVYLTGAGTSWTNSGSLYIGGDTAAVGGTGMVRVYNGAQLDVGGTLKLWDWGNGTLIIDGGTVTAHGFESAGGSFRFLDGMMTVGGGPLNFAARHLSISGMWTDEKPTFVLDGAVGSTCGELTVGTSYEGTMNIQNGATLTTMGDSLIGRFNGSKGTMTVTGSGTSWTTTGNLHLGGYSGGLGGLGTLNVNSGAVKVNNLLKIWDAGTANLSGGTLSAATIDHTHGGTFNFTGGVLHVGMFQGNLVNQGGAICPGGSPGLTTVQGDLVMNAGLIEIELGGLLRGDLYDAIVVTGLLEVGGTLDVLLYDDGSGPFAPQLENTFDILDWGSLTGQFGQLNLPTLAAGLDWDTSALYTTGDLRVVPEPATLSLLALGGLAALRRRWTAS